MAQLSPENNLNVQMTLSSWTLSSLGEEEVEGERRCCYRITISMPVVSIWL